MTGTVSSIRTPTTYLLLSFSLCLRRIVPEQHIDSLDPIFGQSKVISGKEVKNKAISVVARGPAGLFKGV